MCGIAGILTRRSGLELTPLLDEMRVQLRHRGPDDEGQVEINLTQGYRLGLAHTRLSILDLSPAGHQPMTCTETDSWIVFNGEIYNHAQVRKDLKHVKFQSTSDTETILKGWVEHGSKVLQSLRGMFAFALYDGRRQQLWLVRDRLGIKPLYVAAADKDSWIFASEVRTLLATGLVPRRLNSMAVESYLAFGAASAPWTMVDGVKSLLPAEAWQFDLGTSEGASQPQKTRYWQLPVADTASPVTYPEAVERLRPVLRESTALHMVSDVPVGVFLSGGIDSSSLVSTLSYQGYEFETFSVLFGESQFDESVHSRQVAGYFGTRHTEIPFTPASLLDQMESAITAYDQPSMDGINTYFISKAVRRAGIRVALSGIGGDELFAGYSSFGIAKRLDSALVRSLARAAMPALRALCRPRVGLDKLDAIVGSHGTRLEIYGILRQVMMPRRRERLFANCPTHDLLPLPPQVLAELEDSAGQTDALNAYSNCELSLYLANMLLRDTDQMSMAHALEARTPLLDHVLVEEIARIPGQLKWRQSPRGQAKQMLTDAIPQRLPFDAMFRRKMGFVLPWELWLRHELKDQIRSIFSDRAASQSAGLCFEELARFWDDFCNRRPGIRYSDILTLANLLFWVRKNGVSA